MSFGSLSKLFGGLVNNDKREIAGRFGLHPGVMGSCVELQRLMEFTAV